MKFHVRALVAITILGLCLSLQAEPALQFPDQVDKVVLPLQRAGLFLFVPVKLNGQEAGLFWVDTGANVSAIDSAVADRLELPQAATVKIRAVGGGAAAALLEVQSLSVGDVAVGPMLTSGMDLDPMRRISGAPVSGIIGGDVLRHVPFTIDYPASTLTLYDPGTFSPPADVVRSELRIISHLPAVHVRIENQVAGWFHVDTGSNGWLTLHPAFIRLDRDLFLHRPTRPFLVMGLGGMMSAHEIDLASITLLGVTMNDVRAEYDAQGKLLISNDTSGHFGADIMRRFRLTLDYGSGSLWAEHLPDAVPAEWNEPGFDPNAADLHGQTALIRAADEGRIDYVKRFIAAGANVNALTAVRSSALHVAARRGNAEIVNLLIEAGADVNVQSKMKKFTPLMAAAENGYVQVASALIGAGADVKLTDKFGRTALIAAAGAGQVEIVQALINAGADVKATSRSRGTALLAAAGQGHVDVVRALLDAGANADATNESGIRPLHAAAMRGHLDVAQHLLDAGANINACDLKQRTPLMAAAVQGHVAAVELLLDRSADAQLRDSDGLTAFDYAVRRSAVDAVGALYFAARPSASRQAE